jgi:type VI secretion system protein ImpM
MSEANVSSNAVPGWFGKMPNLGDFASRRLPDAFVRRWDRWLQRGLASARSELGEGWLDAYLVAPIRRFWLAPGVLGAVGWAGLLMPSVDRVGRHFPLTIAQPIEPLAAALAARAWFRSLDDAARQVLDVEFTIDDLERELAKVPLADGAAVDDAAERLAARLLGRCAPRTLCSLWWCGDAGDEAEFQCFAALPPATAFASMIGGES